MRIRLIFYSVLFIFLSTNISLFGQEDPACGVVVSSEIADKLYGADSKFRRGLRAFDYSRLDGSEPVNIAIVAHVIRKSDKSGGASNEDIQAAITRANGRYAEMQVQFSLCSTNYIDDTDIFDNTLSYNSTEEKQIANAHNVKNVINIYFYPKAQTSWANFPEDEDDWIVMWNGHLTNNSTFSHELGHYFGLLHTHDRSNGRELVTREEGEKNCDTAGDLCCDTPADPKLSSRVNSECQYTGAAEDANGVPYTPDVTNVMSYSRKSCRNTFSEEQKSIIAFTVLNSRSYLTDNCSGQWNVSYGGTERWASLRNANIAAEDILLGDFNGDGRTDVFTIWDEKWRVSYGGTNDWEILKSNSKSKLKNLKLGDFDGDGKTDVFTTFSGKWHVCYGGKGDWTTINTSAKTVNNLALGDFNGDGKADVFAINSGKWVVSYSGTGSWTTINASSASISNLRLSDFDGDGITDVFTTVSGTWRVSYAGTAPWKTINTSVEAIENLRFGDFNADGKADVFVTTGGKWYVSYEGTGTWTTVNWSSAKRKDILIGDFNGDEKDDVFQSILN